MEVFFFVFLVTDVYLAKAYGITLVIQRACRGSASDFLAQVLLFTWLRLL